MKKILISVVFLLFASTVFSEEFEGVVKKLLYTPSSTSTGVSTGVSSSGKLVTGVTTVYSPAQFIILVKVTWYGKTELKEISVEAEEYAELTEGDFVILESNWWFYGYKRKAVK